MENRFSKFSELFRGEVSVSKRELWLLAGTCFFSGVTIGLIKAAWTHGVTIGCYNGSWNKSGEDNWKEEKKQPGKPENCKRAKAWSGK